jgi:uncharacterized membrane protein/mono/diheme cytochrome c family protein
MNWLSTAGAVVALVFGAGNVRAQPSEGERDFGANVRVMFSQKCAICHGPDLPNPQGRFGYVTDLKRVASNPEMVIPGKPGESELWALVSHGEMPPADSPRGPLSTTEKDTVRAWIAAGAPDIREPSAGSSAPALHPEETAPAPVSLSPTARLVRFLGKFHLLVLHFPIALLVAAGLAELLVAWRGSRAPSPTVQFCLALAALAIVPTVVLGWLHAASGHGVGARQVLSLHRWLGTVAGAGVLLAAVCVWWDARRGVRSWCGRVALAVGVLLVGTTAHFGGLLSHGRDFFDW